MSTELIKTIAVIILAAVLIITLRTRLQEYAFLTALAAVAIVLIFLCSGLFGSFLKLKELFEKSGSASGYFTVALKALGIAYISGFAADVCRDFGMGALAQTAETAGKITIFALSIPLSLAILEAALKFIG